MQPLSLTDVLSASEVHLHLYPSGRDWRIRVRGTRATGFSAFGDAIVPPSTLEAIAAILAGASASLYPETEPYAAAEAAHKAYRSVLQSGSLEEVYHYLRRTGGGMGIPWTLPVAARAAREAGEGDVARTLQELFDGPPALTRCAVHILDNGVLVHLRRTDVGISPSVFVANVIKRLNPSAEIPNLLELATPVQALTEQIFGLMAAMARDGHIVVLVGPSGCGKTLLQMLLTRYILERSPTIGVVVVVDTHPELFGVVREIAEKTSTATPPIVSYVLASSRDAAGRLGELLTSVSPSLVVFQEASGRSQDVVNQAVMAVVHCGVPLLITTYAQIPAEVQGDNAVQVGKNILKNVRARLGGGLTQHVLAVYPGTLFAWLLRDDGAVYVLTEPWEWNGIRLPSLRLDAIPMETVGMHMHAFLELQNRR